MVGLGDDPARAGVSIGGVLPLYIDHHKNLEGLAVEAVQIKEIPDGFLSHALQLHA